MKLSSRIALVATITSPFDGAPGAFDGPSLGSKHEGERSCTVDLGSRE
jgi:hypothetical protein